MATTSATIAHPAQALLGLSHTVCTWRVLSSTSIANRTTAILTTLFPSSTSLSAAAATSEAGAPENDAAVPSATRDRAGVPKAGVIVALTAPAKVANKAISIAEIVKREARVQRPDVRLYQYTALSSELQRVPRERPPKAVGDDTTIDAHASENGDDDDDGNDDGAFEVMKPRTVIDDTAHLDPEKLRNTPILTIYLSTVPVPELRSAYG